MQYFIMISCGNGKITPLVDDDGVMQFDTEEKALNKACENSMAVSFGFEVFKCEDI